MDIQREMLEIEIERAKLGQREYRTKEQAYKDQLKKYLKEESNIIQVDPLTGEQK